MKRTSSEAGNSSSPTVELREVVDSDLPAFFEYQLDPKANEMAAFTAEDPTDRDAFEAHWARIRDNKTVTIRTIIANEHIVGHIAQFERLGDPEITYWIGKPFWGKGLATAALAAFLREVTARPLYARAAKDNIASIRVLQKCGFTVSGIDKGFANARGREIDEVIMKLD